MLSKHITKMVLFMLISLTGQVIFAQNKEAFYDSISVKSFDHKILKFTLNDSLLKEVSFSLSHPTHTKIKAKHIFKDLGTGMLTLVSGVGLENTKNNVGLKFNSKIKSKEGKTGWELVLYCRGQKEKYLQRYNTAEGGHSLSIDHSAHINWDQSVSGEIKKGNSKIGEFVLIKYAKNMEASSKSPIDFLDDFKKKGLDDGENDNENAKHVANDFALIGNLYGVDFKVVTNMRKEKFWIFQGKTIKAILGVSEEGKNAFGKNYNLMVHPDISILESSYWIKMSLLSVFLNRTISTSYYKW